MVSYIKSCIRSYSRNSENLYSNMNLKGNRKLQKIGCKVEDLLDNCTSRKGQGITNRLGIC